MARDRENRSEARTLREAIVKLLYSCELSATPPTTLSKTFWELAQEHDLRRLTKARHGALRQLEERRKKSQAAIKRHETSIARVLRSEPTGEGAKETWNEIRDHLDAIGRQMVTIEKALREADEAGITPALERTVQPVYAAYREIPDLLDRLDKTAAQRPAVRKSLDPLAGTLRHVRALSNFADTIEHPAAEKSSGSPGADAAIRSLGPKQARITRERAGAQATAESIWTHLEEIDAIIGTTATNYRLERIDVIDRCILRLAIHEMLHDDAVPPLVAIDEAIELAKAFGSSGSSAFINGVLDRVLKDHSEAVTGSSDSSGAES